MSPTDLAGVRHTGMLAMAKLEVAPEELQRYRTRHAAAYQITGQGPSRRGHTGGHKPDAWSLIAQMSLAYRAFDFTGATTALRTLMRVYPHAAMPLYFQTEFPRRRVRARERATRKRGRARHRPLRGHAAVAGGHGHPRFRPALPFGSPSTSWCSRPSARRTRTCGPRRTATPTEVRPDGSQRIRPRLS